jgi:hypothetical protein
MTKSQSSLVRTGTSILSSGAIRQLAEKGITMMPFFKLQDLPLVAVVYADMAINLAVHPVRNYRAIMEHRQEQQAQEELDRSFAMMRHPAMRSKPTHVRDEAARRYAERLSRFGLVDYDLPV